jgi:hypothetical protein
MNSLARLRWICNPDKDGRLFQKPRGNMKLFILGIIIIFFFATTGPLSADKVYTWTDQDGNLHITDQPPPEGANVRNVIKYKTDRSNGGRL